MTGAGLVTALGADTRSTWTRLERGESAVAPLRRFDPPPGAARSGAEAGSLDPPPGLRVPKHAKFMGRATRCAVVAATEAIAQASLASAGVDPDRFAIMTGTGDTGLDVEEFFPSLTAAWAGEETLDYAAWGGRASRLVDPYFSLRTLSNAAAALLAIELGARGASSNFVQGACAGAHALAAACDELHERRSDVVLVTGSDALVDLSSWLAYSRVNRLSRLPPDRACRPFDVEADGLALGEAGAALVLERAADARARGARVLGEVAGVGLACARGDDDETGVEAAVTQAAADAGVDRDHPAFVIAHGGAMPAEDRREASSLSAAFGAHRPVTALTGAIGFVGAATALVQVVVALSALASRLVPPVARLERPQQALPIDLVFGSPRPLAGQASDTAVCTTRTFWGEHALVWVRGVGGGEMKNWELGTEK